MKKLILVLALTSALFSCKKETTNPNTPSNDVSISGFDCDSVKIIGALTKDKVASNVTATLTYTGGNGKTYLTKSHTSTGVTGLSATLLAGTLANGEGTLVYTISGTPTSAGTATFAIALGGKSCTITIIVDEFTQNPTSGNGPNITDVENNTYKTVYIGTQQWMGENLKVSKYSDGTTIPNITDNTQWQILTDYLGGENVAGGKLKEVGTTNWNSPNTDATNVSLFTGLPGGYRGGYGYNYGIGGGGYWWSSSEGSTSDAWSRYLGYSDGYAERGFGSEKRGGFSVRCLKD
jgi:hypothetical protein